MKETFLLQKNCKKTQGITLIALVVTIVVLLILAGITISLVFSENGIIAKAQEAANKTKEATINEQTQMNEIADYMENMLNGIGGGSTPPEEPELPIGGEYSEEKGVNTPDLGEGMTPIKWDETANGGAGDWVETEENDPDWYDYSSKKWANAKTSDGSMWVWIPRYAYSITSGYHTNAAGTIEVEFLKGISNEIGDSEAAKDITITNTSGQKNWNVHPAFNYGQPVSGIWVAKFEASHTECTTDVSTGQTNTDNTTLTLQVKPGVTSWRNITIENAYRVCLEYDSKTLENANLNSHMMKNDEWGAVAYLSKSEYGKETEEVWINNSSSYITGSAGNSASASRDIGTTNDYTSTQGVHASTTDNVYGVYDMSGGSWERVAAYVDNGHDNLTMYGNSLYTGSAETKNVYTMGNGDTKLSNYNANMSKYGDAIYETSSGTYNSNGDSSQQSWFNDCSIFSYSNYPFFIRGGNYDYTSIVGLFFFNAYNGIADTNNSFRPVLVAL